MNDEAVRVIAQGATAGVVASFVQAMVGKTEEKLLLPPWEDSNLAPRLMARPAGDLGTMLSAAQRWTLGTAFQLGYGAAWGVAYALVRERYPIHLVAGGPLLGGLTDLITFPWWGGGVQTQTERPPGIRTRRMTVVAASVTLAFELVTAISYHAPRGRSQ